MTERLSAIEINPSSSPIGSIIWLHGLGADGSDFVPVVQELKLPATLPLRFVFPNAPTLPVTINNGYHMPAWYDIVSFSIDQQADEAGIALSSQKIRALIEHEKNRGLPAEKIILAGFSQGAVMALTTGLTYPERLGGMIALSGYLPRADEILQQATIANQSIPIFIGHGLEDSIVPYLLGKNAFQLLKKNNDAVEWHAYAMQHSVCAEEIVDIRAFLMRIFQS